MRNREIDIGQRQSPVCPRGLNIMSVPAGLFSLHGDVSAKRKGKNRNCRIFISMYSFLLAF